jgi:hypothetical protein
MGQNLKTCFCGEVFISYDNSWDKCTNCHIDALLRAKRTTLSSKTKELSTYDKIKALSGDDEKTKASGAETGE